MRRASIDTSQDPTHGLVRALRPATRLLEAEQACSSLTRSPLSPVCVVVLLFVSWHLGFDESIQGIERSDVPAFGFQGHPEASPGPTEMSYLFDKFIAMIKNARTKK